MRTDLDGYVTGNYSYADEFGGHDNIVGVTAGLNYHVTDKFIAYTLGRYIRRGIDGEPGVDNAALDVEEVEIGIRKTF